MNIAFAAAMILAPKGATFKLPIYNVDMKNPVATDWAVTTLPTGFSVEGKIGEGLIKSAEGTISVSLQRSATPMPSLLRNSRAQKGDGFTTIRMTNWIGYRNTRKGGEDYKLNWNRYRVSFALEYKDKAGQGKLREAMHTIIDGLNLK